MDAIPPTNPTPPKNVQNKSEQENEKGKEKEKEEEEREKEKEKENRKNVERYHWMECVRVVQANFLVYYHNMRFFYGGRNWVTVSPFPHDDLALIQSRSVRIIIIIIRVNSSIVGKIGCSSFMASSTKMSISGKPLKNFYNNNYNEL